MAQRLLNKVAVVTGAGSGIGRAIAERFLNEGAKVVAFSRTRASLESLEATAPTRVLAVAGDVTQAADLRELVAAGARRFGSIDVVVPCAGVLQVISAAESTPAAFEQQFSVNILGAVETVRAFLPHLATGSAVVFITGGLARAGIANLGIYNASKAALAAWAQALAVELAPRKIRVNAIAPGPTATPLWEKLNLSPEAREKLKSQLATRLVTGEFATPDDVAEAAVFLASDASANIFGREIAVDGGCGLLSSAPDA